MFTLEKMTFQARLNRANNGKCNLSFVAVLTFLRLVECAELSF